MAAPIKQWCKCDVPVMACMANLSLQAFLAKNCSWSVIRTGASWRKDPMSIIVCVLHASRAFLREGYGPHDYGQKLSSNNTDPPGSQHVVVKA